MALVVLEPVAVVRVQAVVAVVQLLMNRKISVHLVKMMLLQILKTIPLINRMSPMLLLKLVLPNLL
jgi:hypothetical protein